MRARFEAEGDVIVITGGANGIGRALARAAGRGARHHLRCKPGMHIAKAENPLISTVRLDASDRSAVFAAFGQIEREFGRIDSLVCGAAIQPRTQAHEMASEEWGRVVAWCYQAAVSGMIARRRGSIVAFTSGLAHQGRPEAFAYASTKAALIAFVKSAVKEVAQHRARFNLMAPGVIDTPQYRAANAGPDDAWWRASLGVGVPEDVVGPLLFLLSDAASMTASTISSEFAYPAQDGSAVPGS